jgi:hypothetical protein
MAILAEMAYLADLAELADLVNEYQFSIMYLKANCPKQLSSDFILINL